MIVPYNNYFKKNDRLTLKELVSLTASHFGSKRKKGKHDGQQH